MDGRERYFKLINFRRKWIFKVDRLQIILVAKKYISTCRKYGDRVALRGRTVFAGGSWDARSNPRVATSDFFFLSSFFYRLVFYFLFSLLTLLASRDFCENVFLVEFGFRRT